MYKKIGIGIILCVFLFFLTNIVMVIVENRTGKILIEETEDGKVVVLYDKQNHVIDTVSCIEKTSVTQLTDDLYEIAQSVGSPARYVFYYDIKTCRESEVFFNPILIEYQYIAYMEDGELVICDIFNKDMYCRTIARDFTKTADPVSAIRSIILDGEGRFVIEYYQGEMYEIVSETL